MVNVHARASDRMPTAARLVAALTGCAASVSMVYVLMHYYPDAKIERDLGILTKLFGIIGLLVGWRILGKKVADSGSETGIGLGLQSGLIVMFFVCFALALTDLWDMILKGRLRGEEPMKAIYFMGVTMLEYAQFMLHAKVAGIAIFLAASVGWMTRNAHRRWR